MEGNRSWFNVTDPGQRNLDEAAAVLVLADRPTGGNARAAGGPPGAVVIAAVHGRGEPLAARPRCPSPAPDGAGHPASATRGMAYPPARMRVHLLDFNGGAANRGTAALLGLLGGGVRHWRTREAAELPPGGDGVWVLTGGPGSPMEEGPWRAPLLDALGARAARGAPTLAICYGFELLAMARGARLTPLARPRVGLVPLRLTAAGRADTLLGGLDGAATFENRAWGVFGGDGETLAEGDEGDRVAVRYGRGVVGVMFHPEAGAAGGRAAVEELGLPGDPDALERVHAALVAGFLRGVGA